MIAYFFYIFILLFLLIIQTSVFMVFQTFDGFYDLLIIFVLFFALFKKMFEGLPFILLAGLMMDGLTGGIFGLYVTSYLWSFMIIKRLTRYFHSASILFLLLSILFMIIFENLIFAITSLLVTHKFDLVKADVVVFFKNIVWGFITGPLFLLYISYLDRLKDKYCSKILYKAT